MSKVEFRYRIIVSSYNLSANATDDHSVCTASLCAPTELPLRCRRPYCAAMETLRRPHCTLLRRPWHRQARAFVLSVLKVSAIVLRSMRPHGVYWRCHCVAVAMLAIILCAPWHSGFKGSLIFGSAHIKT